MKQQTKRKTPANGAGVMPGMPGDEFRQAKLPLHPPNFRPSEIRRMRALRQNFRPSAPAPESQPQTSGNDYYDCDCEIGAVVYPDGSRGRGEVAPVTLKCRCGKEAGYGMPRVTHRKANPNSKYKTHRIERQALPHCWRYPFDKQTGEFLCPDCWSRARGLKK